MVNQTPDQKNKLIGSGWVSQVLQMAPVLAVLTFFVFLGYVAVNRVAYPHDLEWMEGRIVAHVLRLLHGEPLYAILGRELIDGFPLIDTDMVVSRRTVRSIRSFDLIDCLVS